MTSECNSAYTVNEGMTLTCEQHYEHTRTRRHQAKYLDIWWYWSDEEADRG